VRFVFLPTGSCFVITDYEGSFRASEGAHKLLVNGRESDE
jgi:hypothetical protein